MQPSHAARALCPLLGGALTLALGCTHGAERSPARTDASAQALAPEPPPAPTEDARASAPPEPAVMHAASREIMSTWFELKVLSNKPREDVQRDLAVCLDEIARLEDVLSEWRPNTEISRINQGAGGPPIPVGEDTWTVVSTGQRVAEESQGTFDLTWAALRGLYLFGKDDVHRPPDPKELAKKLKLVGYKDLVLNEEAHTVQLKRAGMAIGTGGIAKGYALDRVEALLLARGHEDFLLFAGGQVQTHGTREGRPWRIGIRHPRKSTHVGAFELGSASVATSGDYEHFYEHAGTRVHHIIDLATGKPADKSASVSLIARRGIDADALAKVCFIRGPAGCIAYLEKLEVPADAVIIAPDLSVHMTRGMADRVRFDPPLVDGRLPE